MARLRDAKKWWRFERLKHEAVGGVIPDGYGFAYRETTRFVEVFYPIPLNIIVGFWRNVILGRLEMGFFKSRFNQRLLVERTDGYNEGFKSGLRMGEHAAEKNYWQKLEAPKESFADRL